MPTSRRGQLTRRQRGRAGLRAREPRTGDIHAHILMVIWRRGHDRSRPQHTASEASVLSTILVKARTSVNSPLFRAGSR